MLNLGYNHFDPRRLAGRQSKCMVNLVLDNEAYARMDEAFNVGVELTVTFPLLSTSVFVVGGA